MPSRSVSTVRDSDEGDVTREVVACGPGKRVPCRVVGPLGAGEAGPRKRAIHVTVEPEGLKRGSPLLPDRLISLPCPHILFVHPFTHSFYTHVWLSS